MQVPQRVFSKRVTSVLLRLGKGGSDGGDDDVFFTRFTYASEAHARLRTWKVLHRQSRRRRRNAAGGEGTRTSTSTATAGDSTHSMLSAVGSVKRHLRWWIPTTASSRPVDEENEEEKDEFGGEGDPRTEDDESGARRTEPNGFCIGAEQRKGLPLLCC